jgi:alpha-tubulin suppressor-like RCC1 family protein
LTEQTFQSCFYGIWESDLKPRNLRNHLRCFPLTVGCLGHGDWHSMAIPKLVETLLSVDVSAVACGPEHVVVVGGQGDVYAWGRGLKGRLGLGHEEDCCAPQEVTALNTEDIYIVNVSCSGAGTLLLTDSGVLYACGENNENRFGFSIGFFFYILFKAELFTNHTWPRVNF